MGTKALIAAGTAAGLLMTGGVARGDASWANQPYQLSIPTEITGRGQSVSGSINLTLNHDVQCTLNVSASGGDEVLRNGGSPLTTQYKLRGACLAFQDDNWVSSTDFILPGNTYTAQGTGPTDTITLWVQATAPADSDPPAGNYTATLTVTASWP